MKRWFAVVAVLAAFVVACDDASKSSSGNSSSSSGAPAKKPNVVLILIDTLRPDHLAAWGYARDNAPFLNELAAKSVVFQHAYSASSWTAPATASLFTSLYPPQHGIKEGFFVHRKRSAVEQEAGEQTISLNRLPDAARTLPEHFARAGWSTWGITANVNVTSRIGFDRGFQKFHDFTGPEYGKGAAADVVLGQVKQWKQELDGAQPYFLYLHFNDVHSPWRDYTGVANKPLDPLAKNRELYDGEIRYVDEGLRRIAQELAWNDDTLVCIVSDHGEEFLEHGGTGHNFSLYRELMQIVWMISWPSRWKTQKLVASNVSIIDVFPTLAELAGAPFPSGLEGRSAASAIDAPAEDDSRTLFAHRFDAKEPDDLWAVVRGRWKLVAHGNTFELFEMSKDPLERNDRSAKRPEVVAELRRALDEFRARAKPIAGSSVNVQLGADEIEALKGLGYTDDGH